MQFMHVLVHFGKTGKANKTDPIGPFLPAISLERECAPVPPIWIRPCSTGNTRDLEVSFAK